MNAAMPDENDEDEIDDDLKPIPPKTLQHIKWILLRGKHHKKFLAMGTAVLVIAWLSKDWIIPVRFTNEVTGELMNVKLQQTIEDLRKHYREARDRLDQSSTVDFAAAESDVAQIMKLDADNGHAWYYAGEIKRVTDTTRFTSKGCIRTPIDLTVPLDQFHNDFYRYLELEATRPASEKSGSTGSEICYTRPGGFCPQRTAWIHHVLANDLFLVGEVLSDRNARVEKYKRALQHASTSLILFPDGFDQCTPTKTLIKATNERLQALR